MKHGQVKIFILNSLVMTEADQFKAVLAEAVKGLLAQTKVQPTAPEMLTETESMACL